MAVPLSPEDHKQALASIKRFLADELELEPSDLKASLALDFFLKEIAPTIYNGAIKDAQVFLRDRLGDLEATCYHPEFGYWPKGSAVRRK